MKQRYIQKLSASVCMVLVMIMSASCDKDLKRALDVAGDNKAELEKVLKHFEDDPDPLKYESAKFLIENMPSQYQMSGNTVDMIDSLYLETSGESQNNRTKFFNTEVSGIDPTQARVVYDISNMKAPQLIKAINDACDAWSSSTWHEDYDESVFFEYVLPYRLSHETMSDWHSTISDEYPLLSQDIVMSRRGLQFEAEHHNTIACETKEYVGASNGYVEMMCSNKSSVSFTVDAERTTCKRLIMKYSSVAHNLNATICVNGAVVETLHLAPTRNIESFTEKWFNFSMPLKKGKNTITISSASDTLCVDYIQLGALENFSHDDDRDFSDNYYSIVNAKSQLYITYDTASAAKTISLKRHSESDSTQLLRLDYAGYPLWRIGYYKKDSVDMCLQMEFGVPNTLQPNTPVTQGTYVKRPFDQWLFIPVGNDTYRIMNKHTGLFLDSYRDSIAGCDILVQNKYSEKESQKWQLRKRGKNPYADRCYRFRSAVSEAMRVFDLTHQFEYYIYNSPFGTKASSLFKTKSGKRADETSFTVYLCRHLGIPAAYDFTPHWGNRSSSHSWSVLINGHGKAIPYYMGNFPGDTAHYFNSYIKPKVFRYRYSINRQIMSDMRHELSVPELFQHPHFTDVTDEYCATTDVVRPVPDKYKDKKVAYICVFDNRNWVPVHYGNVCNGFVGFKSMGRGIVYMAGFYVDGEIVPFGNPFLITDDGRVKDFELNHNKKIKMKLLRKYPFMGAQDYFNSRMNGGQFQGSNKSDFSDSTVFHIHKGITNGNWYDIPVNTDGQFKYLRYMGGKGSYCNINELEFFGPDGNKLEGSVIGTDGESWAKKENVFDGNILTGFCANSPDGNWVGLKLAKPSRISKIKYIGRNDGNGIEIGDVYELYCWNPKGYWDLIETKKATDNVIYFNNVPSGGLYILKDVTKGVEERIFTYDGSKQVWW